MAPNCQDPSTSFLTNSWTVALPDGKPVVQQMKTPNPYLPTLRVLHLSDIHYDPLYTVGAEVDCVDERYCCKPTDVAKTVTNPAGYWGSLGNGTCNVPQRTVETMLDHIRNTEKLDYIMFTGDLAPNDVWNYTKTRLVQQLRNLTSMFHEYFPGLPVYATLGNHDSVPTDSLPPNGVPARFSHDWLYDTLAEQWGTFLPRDTVSTIKYRASYAVTVRPGLRLISLNTLYCDYVNFWLFMNSTDPDETLQWLVTQLHAAELNNDKVHIIGHILPGDFTCLAEWSRNYYRIVNRFESTIRGQFFGHTHYDSFSIFYENGDPRGRATNMYYTGPSVTTFHRVAPAYRVYTVDGEHKDSTWTVLDHETYYAPNIQDVPKHKKPRWDLEYTAKKAYNLSSLFPEDWNQLIYRFNKDPSLFNDFLFRRRRLDDTKCFNDSKCKKQVFCELRSARSYDEKKLCPDFFKHHRHHRS